MEHVILVDEADRPLGTADKMEAHRECARHRAFSVFVVSPAGDLLLQQRHEAKYHTGGLWTNACDGHPRPGEDVAAAAGRRLREEMGFSSPLEHLFSFTYEAAFDDGLTECEFDHVYLGLFDGDPTPDPAEVAAWRWVGPEELGRAVAAHPEEYAIWLRLALPRVLAHLAGQDPDDPPTAP